MAGCRLVTIVVALFLGLMQSGRGDDGHVIFSTGSVIRHVAWSPDDSLVALACEKNEIALVRLTDGEIVRTLNVPVGRRPVLGFSRDSQLLAVTGSTTGAAIVIANVKDGQTRLLPGDAGFEPLQLRLSGNTGERLAVLGGGGRLIHWDVASGSITGRWKASLFPTPAKQHLADDDSLLGMDSDSTPPRLWKTAGDEFRQVGGNSSDRGPDKKTKFSFGERAIEAISVAPDLKSVVAAIRVLDPAEKTVSRWMEIRDVSSTDIKYLGRISIGSFRTDVPPKIAFKTAGGGVSCIEHSPDGKLIVAGGAASSGFQLSTNFGVQSWSDSDFSIRVWDIETRWECDQFKGHTKTVESVHFTADGKKLFSAGQDGTVRQWELSESLQPVE